MIFSKAAQIYFLLFGIYLFFKGVQNNDYFMIAASVITFILYATKSIEDKLEELIRAIKKG